LDYKEFAIALTGGSSVGGGSPSKAGGAT
jgi:hypothetical protein